MNIEEYEELYKDDELCTLIADGYDKQYTQTSPMTIMAHCVKCNEYSVVWSDDGNKRKFMKSIQEYRRFGKNPRCRNCS